MNLSALGWELPILVYPVVSTVVIYEVSVTSGDI